MIPSALQPLFRKEFRQALQALSSTGSSAVQAPLANGTSLALKFNTLEDKVPAYELANPLILPTGAPVTDTATWLNIQRPRLLDRFQNEVYGLVPKMSLEISYEPLSEVESTLVGQAIRKE